MKSLENKTTLIFDLFFCAVFMPALVFLGPAHSWMTWLPSFFTVVCLYMYACYFVIRYLNIPRLLIERRYWLIAGIVSGLVALNYILTLYPRPGMDFVMPSLSEYQTRVRDYGISLTLWLMFSLVMGYAFVMSLVKELYGQLLLKKKIEIQRDQAKLAVFKAQISPHFLFNTLNSLYSLVIGTSQRAEDAFIKFTEILKYTYVTIDNESVPIRDEIEYIGNYIDLQLIRLNAHTRVDWRYDVDDEEVMIPPMLMLTFVENVFKYGVSTSRDCDVVIRLQIKDGKLDFLTQNKIMKHADEFRSQVPVGIDNCKARLSALYPLSHSLVTAEDNGLYKVHLKIELK